MKRALLAVATLVLVVALAEGFVLAGIRIDPTRVAAVLSSLVLILAPFVAFTNPAVARLVRQRVVRSTGLMLGAPFLLLIPYLIFALGMRGFSILAVAKLAAYIAAPTLLLFPDRIHHASRAGWRDFAAMLALAIPVSAGWLRGIWVWPPDRVFTEPEELYFFLPLFCVCVGSYAFLVVRNLDGVGYRLGFRKGDIVDGLTNFAGFALVGIPLGYALHFIRFHPHGISLFDLGFQLFAIYLTIAIPEEFLFRGVLQNFLTKTLSGPRRAVYALLIASVIFGASHLHHAPVPNWRYAIMAALAGLFYGNAYRTRQRLSSPALTHALVDTVWHFWF
ncbi:MAG: type II CAAX prenyl endopeptidase Rce1 family protein [Terriglobia bacterium]